MLKVIASSLLATPILLGVSAATMQSSAQAATTFCNKTRAKVYVAYARGETYGGRANLPPGIGQSVSDVPTSYNVGGWWGINPGSCSRVTNEPANRVVRGDNLYYVSHQFYARAVDTNNYWASPIWDGTGKDGAEKFCIRNAVFKYGRSLGGFVSPQPLSCAGDYYSVRMQSFTSNATNKTINLTY